MHQPAPSEQAPPSPKLRTRDAARHVGLAPATLIKLRCVGGGPLFTRLCQRTVVYDIADLEAWVAAHGKLGSTANARVGPDSKPPIPAKRAG